jgi:hypothetical protein
MHAGSRRDRVIDVMRISSSPLDDDLLARRADISPRQSVNQICRELERTGLVRRRPGPDGKIVNEWLGNRDGRPENGRPASHADLSQTPLLAESAALRDVSELPPGSSREQRDAERVMLDLLSQQLGRELNPATLMVPSGERVEVDGADADRSILAECWAHQGPPKSAQRHKVLADAFKLTWISTRLDPRPRLILCLSDQLAAAPFLPEADRGQPGPSKISASLLPLLTSRLTSARTYCKHSAASTDNGGSQVHPALTVYLPELPSLGAGR